MRRGKEETGGEGGGGGNSVIGPLSGVAAGGASEGFTRPQKLRSITPRLWGRLSQLQTLTRQSEEKKINNTPDLIYSHRSFCFPFLLTVELLDATILKLWTATLVLFSNVSRSCYERFSSSIVKRSRHLLRTLFQGQSSFRLVCQERCFP